MAGGDSPDALERTFVARLADIFQWGMICRDWETAIDRIVSLLRVDHVAFVFCDEEHCGAAPAKKGGGTGFNTNDDVSYFPAKRFRARWGSRRKEAPYPAVGPRPDEIEAFDELSSRGHRAQPLQGCERPAPRTQCSSFLGTLGSMAESLWDSQFEEVHGPNAPSWKVEAFHEPAGKDAAPTELERRSMGVDSHNDGAPAELKEESR